MYFSVAGILEIVRADFENMPNFVDPSNSCLTRKLKVIVKINNKIIINNTIHNSIFLNTKCIIIYY